MENLPFYFESYNYTQFFGSMGTNSTFTLGQRMGEYDMFVKTRDSDKPFRPSLPTNWEQQQQYLAAANATSRF